MRMRRSAWGMAGLGLAMAGAASAAPIAIDNFQDDQSVLVTGGSGLQTAENGVVALNAIGDARNLLLTRLSGYGTDALTVNGGGMALLDFSSAAADAVTARLLYDGGTDGTLSATGLGGVDLTDSGSNSLIRILARSDLSAPITVTVYTDAGNYSSKSLNLPGAGFGGAFSALDFDFASFVAGAGTGANFANVGALTIEISGAAAPSLDAQLDSIVATVPEPATLPMLGAGLVGLALLGGRPPTRRSAPTPSRSGRPSGAAGRAFRASAR